MFYLKSTILFKYTIYFHILMVYLIDFYEYIWCFFKYLFLSN